VDPQLKSDILLAMALAFGGLMLFRFWPRLQTKLMGVSIISCEDAKRRLDEEKNILVIDVRSADEFKGDMGHIKGALNLQANTLHEKLLALGDDLDPYKAEKIIIVCRTQKRSPKAARILFQSGFGKMSILRDGMMGWTKAGYPVTRAG